jgi:hypothetical protein
MKIKIIAFLSLSTLIAACGDASNTTTNTTNTNTVTNAAPSNAVTYSTPTQEPTTNNAPTLTPVVRGYYDALKNKDSAALKMVLSDEFIKSIQADMKEEKKTDMAMFLAETDKIPEKPIEVRNEKIQGDKAVAEIRGGAYPNWTPLAFVKEGGNWKLTNESPAIENVSGANK